jgi:hypothetical protein
MFVLVSVSCEELEEAKNAKRVCFGISHMPCVIACSPDLRHKAPMLMRNNNQAAKLHYMANGYRMLSNGDHVVCAVTSERIPLEDLRYWNVVTQSPYASAEIATRALMGKA